MNTSFETKLRAAAHAGWHVVLAAASCLIIQYAIYIYLDIAQPSWLNTIWGRNLPWAYIRSIWIWGMLAFKILLSICIILSGWLSLWARQLNRVHS